MLKYFMRLEFLIWEYMVNQKLLLNNLFFNAVEKKKVFYTDKNLQVNDYVFLYFVIALIVFILRLYVQNVELLLKNKSIYKFINNLLLYIHVLVNDLLLV